MFLGVALVLALRLPSVLCANPKLIPSDHSQLDAWIAHNMKDYLDRKASAKKNATQASFNVDPQLAKAEDAVRIVKVRKDGKGHFKTVTDAVNSIPDGNTRRVVVWIGGGEYREKITVTRSKPFVTFYGDEHDMPTIVFDGTALQYGTVYSATVAVESDYFVAVNVAFVVRIVFLVSYFSQYSSHYLKIKNIYMYVYKNKSIMNYYFRLK